MKKYLGQKFRFFVDFFHKRVIFARFIIILIKKALKNVTDCAKKAYFAV